jgi:hypothetical protein
MKTVFKILPKADGQRWLLDRLGQTVQGLTRHSAMLPGISTMWRREMDINEMSANELRQFRSELEVTMSQVTDRLEALDPNRTMKRGDSWCVTLKRMVHIPETAVVVVKAAAEDEAECVAGAVAEDCCWGDDLDWDRDCCDEETDDWEVDGIEPSDDLPDYRLNDHGKVVAIDEEGGDLRLVGGEDEHED